MKGSREPEIPQEKQAQGGAKGSLRETCRRTPDGLYLFHT